MECPSCRAGTKVLDTRPTGDAVRRRRVCVDCGRRFTTHERPDRGADDVERAVVAYIRDLNRTEEVAAA